MEASELKEILDQHKLWLDRNGGSRADLTGANLRGANLYRAYLYRANLYRADLRRADLTGAILRGADLRGADLRGADLRGADLEDANLYNANLYGANLEDVSFINANLRGANLYRAYLKDAILPDVSWVIPGCLVQLNNILYGFYLEKERKGCNFVQDSFGFIVQNNPVEKTFDMLVEDQIIRGIPDWVKYTGLKQIESESV